MPADIALDENFDVFINARGDLAIVEGNDQFEQEVIIRITARYHDLISELDRDAVRELVEVEARRVADEMNRLSRVAAFGAEFSDEDPNTLVVTIIYDTGEDFVFDVN